MDFRSINKFNILVNSVSGNFLPLTEGKTNLGFGYSIYAFITWLFNFLYLFSTISGLLLNCSASEVLQKGGPMAATSLEMLIYISYHNSQRERLRKLIGKINSIILDSAVLEKYIRESIDPYTKRLQIYVYTSIAVLIVWVAMPVFKVFEKHRFTAMDYTLPSYVPGSPVTASVFVLCIFVQTIGMTYNMFKKVAIEVYISHFIGVITAEYRYVREEVVAAFGKNDDNSVIDALKKCVKHHCNTIETGNMLVDSLAVNIGVIYLACIFRFCFLAYTTITMPGAYFVKFLSATFMMGGMVQVFMFCTCIQELLEASTSVFDDAFYEDWHARELGVKKFFCTIRSSKQMECRLSAYAIIDLTVPTFATILNKSYSACLFLLKM